MTPRRLRPHLVLASHGVWLGLGLGLLSGCGATHDDVGTQRGSSDPPAEPSGSITPDADPTAALPDAVDASTCEFPTEAALRIADPATPAEELFNRLLKPELDRLYTAIGRYADGTVPVFQGPLSAVEYRAGSVNQAIDSPRVVAAVHSRERADEFTAPNRELLVFDATSESMLSFYQYSAVRFPTRVSPISSFYASGGIPLNCSDCLTALALVSDRFEVTLSLQGKYPDDSALELDVTGSLERIPPSALTLDDLLTVTSTADSPDFGKRAQPRVDGERFVFDRRGTERNNAAKDANGCYQAIDYRLEWFVRGDCLKAYGVRNLVSEAPRTVCPTTAG